MKNAITRIRKEHEVLAKKLLDALRTIHDIFIEEEKLKDELRDMDISIVQTIDPFPRKTFDPGDESTYPVKALVESLRQHGYDI